MIQESRGFSITKVGRTISDVIQCGWVSLDIIRQAVFESLSKGLIQKREVEALINTVHVFVAEDTRKQLALLLKEIKK
jgi:hypothetical protein